MNKCHFHRPTHTTPFEDFFFDQVSFRFVFFLASYGFARLKLFRFTVSVVVVSEYFRASKQQQQQREDLSIHGWMDASEEKIREKKGRNFDEKKC